jgi:AraC-like DNA-binding protein
MDAKQGFVMQRAVEAPGRACGDVRVGPLLPIPSLLAELGLDPAQVLAQVGLDLSLFDDPDNRVSFFVLGRLLEACVNLTKRPDFGLLIGQRFKLESLGVLGQLIRNCATVRDALRMAAMYLEIHDRGAISLTLDLGDGKSALGYSLFEGRTPAAEQILDGAIAIQHLLLRDLCGPAWRPVLVQLSHSQPAKVAPFRKLFDAALEFDARLSAIVFESRWLDHRIAGADPAAYAAVARAVEASMSEQALPFGIQVRRALHAMMFTSAATSANLACLFNIRERTLRRRLEQEGTTVRALAGDVRRELALHLLRDTDLPVTEIAAALHYSDVAVFARAFRGWSHSSPREWRAKHGSGQRADRASARTSQRRNGKSPRP